MALVSTFLIWTALDFMVDTKSKYGCCGKTNLYSQTFDRHVQPGSNFVALGGTSVPNLTFNNTDGLYNSYAGFYYFTFLNLNTNVSVLATSAPPFWLLTTEW